MMIFLVRTTLPRSGALRPYLGPAFQQPPVRTTLPRSGALRHNGIGRRIVDYIVVRTTLPRSGALRQDRFEQCYQEFNSSNDPPALRRIETLTPQVSVDDRSTVVRTTLPRSGALRLQYGPSSTRLSLCSNDPPALRRIET